MVDKYTQGDVAECGVLTPIHLGECIIPLTLEIRTQGRGLRRGHLIATLPALITYQGGDDGYVPTLVGDAVSYTHLRAHET